MSTVAVVSSPCTHASTAVTQGPASTVCNIYSHTAEQGSHQQTVPPTAAAVSGLELRSVKPYRTQDEYLYAMKEDLAEWLNALYNLSMTADSLLEHVETGVLLCRHARVMQGCMADQRLGGRTGPKEDQIHPPPGLVAFGAGAKPGTFHSRDNVSNFIAWCRHELRVPETLLFETDDLVMRKNERNVVLCILETARRGVSLGIPAPVLVQLEIEIDEEIKADKLSSTLSVTQPNVQEDNKPEAKRRPAIAVDMMSLDEMVRDILGRCTCPDQFPMIRVSEGKYKIGDSLTMIFVRILRSHVMVRIGGGWDTLENYLNRHDPCQCQNKGHVTRRRSPAPNNRRAAEERPARPRSLSRSTSQSESAARSRNSTPASSRPPSPGREKASLSSANRPFSLSLPYRASPTSAPHTTFTPEPDAKATSRPTTLKQSNSSWSQLKLRRSSTFSSPVQQPSPTADRPAAVTLRATAPAGRRRTIEGSGHGRSRIGRSSSVVSGRFTSPGSPGSPGSPVEMREQRTQKINARIQRTEPDQTDLGSRRFSSSEDLREREMYSDRNISISSNKQLNYHSVALQSNSECVESKGVKPQVVIRRPVNQPGLSGVITRTGHPMKAMPPRARSVGGERELISHREGQSLPVVVGGRCPEGNKAVLMIARDTEGRHKIESNFGSRDSDASRNGDFYDSGEVYCQKQITPRESTIRQKLQEDLKQNERLEKRSRGQIAVKSQHDSLIGEMGMAESDGLFSGSDQSQQRTPVQRSRSALASANGRRRLPSVRLKMAPEQILPNKPRTPSSSACEPHECEEKDGTRGSANEYSDAFVPRGEERNVNTGADPIVMDSGKGDASDRKKLRKSVSCEANGSIVNNPTIDDASLAGAAVITAVDFIESCILSSAENATGTDRTESNEWLDFKQLCNDIAELCCTEVKPSNAGQGKELQTAKNRADLAPDDSEIQTDSTYTYSCNTNSNTQSICNVDASLQSLHDLDTGIPSTCDIDTGIPSTCDTDTGIQSLCTADICIPSLCNVDIGSPCDTDTSIPCSDRTSDKPSSACPHIDDSEPRFKTELVWNNVSAIFSTTASAPGKANISIRSASPVKFRPRKDGRCGRPTRIPVPLNAEIQKNAREASRDSRRDSGVDIESF